MAPFEEKIAAMRELDDEELINGTRSTQTVSTIWSVTSLDSDDFVSGKSKQQQAQMALESHCRSNTIHRDTSNQEKNKSQQLTENQKLSLAARKTNYGSIQNSAIENRSFNIIDKQQNNGTSTRGQFSKSLDFSANLDHKKFDFRSQSNEVDESKKIRSIRGDNNGDTNDESRRISTNSQSVDKKTILERAAKVIPGLGIMLSLCASISLGSAGMLVKMTHSVNGIQVAVLRSLIQLIIYTFIISVRKLSILPDRSEWLPVFGRAVLGATSMCFTYYALNLIPLGDATAIRFSLPIWTLIISYFFLSESCHFSKIIAIVVAITGVVLIAKPDECIYLIHNLWRALGMESDKEFQLHKHEHEEAREHELEALIELNQNNQSSPLFNGTESFNGSSTDTTDEIALVLKDHHKHPVGTHELAVQQFEGCMLALASSILLSLSLIALRLAKKTPAEVTIFWLSVLSVLIGNVLLLVLKEWSLPDNLHDICYIILNGLCGSAGQWFITSALKIEQSSIIALARTFDIEVAFIYSALLLHENIRLTSIVGAILVSLGVVIVVVPRWLGCYGNPVQVEEEEPADSGDIEEDSIEPDHSTAHTSTTKLNGGMANGFSINNNDCDENANHDQNVSKSSRVKL